MSKTAKRFPRDKALNVAKTVARLLLNQPENCCIAGSLRRGHSDVGDIDIVLMNCQAFQTAWMLSSPEWKVEKNGPKYKRAIVQGIPIDIYIAKDRVQFAMLKLVRTGSKEHNIYLVRMAKQRGLEFKAGDALYDGSRRLLCTTESEIFGALDLNYDSPERREINDKPRRATG